MFPITTAPVLGNYVAPLRPKTFTTQQFTPPGIVPAAAYADLDAIGLQTIIEVPLSGVILSASYYDQDNEGLTVRLWLFTGPVAPQTDNGAFVVGPGDILKVLTVIQFSTFWDGNTAKFSTVANIGKGYTAPSGRLYAAVQAGGALNIATLARPLFSLDILPD